MTLATHLGLIAIKETTEAISNASTTTTDYPASSYLTYYTTNERSKATEAPSKATYSVGGKQSMMPLQPPRSPSMPPMKTVTFIFLPFSAHAPLPAVIKKDMPHSPSYCSAAFGLCNVAKF